MLGGISQPIHTITHTHTHTHRSRDSSVGSAQAPRWMTEESQLDCRQRQTSFAESQDRFWSPPSLLLSWQRGRDRRAYIHLYEDVIMNCYILIFIYARAWTATDGGIHSHIHLRQEVTGLRTTIVCILISCKDLH